MPAHRKYDSWPGPHSDEIPYDIEHFKMWCINEQELSESTVKAYLGAIRRAYGVLFDNRDVLFKNLRNAFLSMPAYHQKNMIEKGIDRLEDNYDTLEAYIEAIEECGDVVLDEWNCDIRRGKEKKSNKAMWVTAFRTYSRYIRWRIDIQRKIYGFGIYTPDVPEKFFELPFSKEFKQYLRTIGKGYENSSITSYYCVIKRVYNLLLRHFDIEHEFYNMIWDFKKGEPVQEYMDFVLVDIIEAEIEDRDFPELSLNDLSRAKTVCRQYIYFLRDYAENPDKYPRYVYELRLPKEGKN